jgi:hypothetical protein
MRRTTFFAISLTASIAGAAPALAQYGAIAYDIANGRWGATWNQPTPAAAQEHAMRDCNSGGCQIRLAIGPHQCGALATTENRKGWGTAIHASRDSAKLSALENCQRANSGECLVRAWDCNR